MAIPNFNDYKYIMFVDMSKFLGVTGILLVLIGTIFSLWAILGTKTKNVGTANYYDNQQDNFKKDKIKVLIGIILISLGSLLQIIGLFL